MNAYEFETSLNRLVKEAAASGVYPITILTALAQAAVDAEVHRRYQIEMENEAGAREEGYPNLISKQMEEATLEAEEPQGIA